MKEGTFNTMKVFDVKAVRRDFPILSSRIHGHPLIYLDNAATTQKPRIVQDSLNQFYKLSNANVHRGAHSLSNRATTAFEQARESVAQFINANSNVEVIWTKGTTESINLVANSLGTMILSAGDVILVSSSEHHANIVPWQLIAQAKQAKVIPIPLTDSLQIDQNAYCELLQQHRPKIVALGHVSNALGIRHPIEEMITQAKAVGAYTLIDGAQSVAHEVVDVQHLNCDFYVFSGHKCFAPTGIGVLWGRQHLLEKMPPWQGGGEMIESVSFDQTTFNQLPFKFEAGTPPIAAAIGLAAAIKYLATLDRLAAAKHERHLAFRLAEGCKNLTGVRVYYNRDDNVGVVAFSVLNVHHQDIAVLLDQSGIAVRSGHHCAMPLMNIMQVKGTLRASISFYNTEQEIDYFITALKEALSILKQNEPAPTLDNVNQSALFDPSSAPSAAELISVLQGAKTWQERFQYIMNLADVLPPPSRDLLQDTHRLQQCESGVWLSMNSTGAASFKQTKLESPIYVEFQAWSDAKIMRGLLVLLICCREQIHQEEMNFLSMVKLDRYLSPSRTNGVQAIIQQLLSLRKL